MYMLVQTVTLNSGCCDCLLHWNVPGTLKNLPVRFWWRVRTARLSTKIPLHWVRFACAEDRPGRSWRAFSASSVMLLFCHNIVTAPSWICRLLPLVTVRWMELPLRGVRHPAPRHEIRALSLMMRSRLKTREFQWFVLLMLLKYYTIPLKLT